MGFENCKYLGDWFLCLALQLETLGEEPTKEI